MKKPLIGVTPLYDDRMTSYWMIPGYMKGILQAGGLPVILPFIQNPEDVSQLVSQLDGLLFTGGPDVNPLLYGEEVIMESGILAPQRDILEVACLREAVERDLPCLGICRGLQLMNVVMGGSLYQDMETQHPTRTEHDQDHPYDALTHDVEIVAGSPLAQWTGGALEMRVNTLHHQAVKELAPGLAVMARSKGEDIVEAIWAPDKKFFCAVQWHPEFAHSKHPEHQAIFDAFVEACRK